MRRAGARRPQSCLAIAEREEESFRVATRTMKMEVCMGVVLSHVRSCLTDACQ